MRIFIAALIASAANLYFLLQNRGVDALLSFRPGGDEVLAVQLTLLLLTLYILLDSLVSSVLARRSRAAGRKELEQIESESSRFSAELLEREKTLAEVKGERDALKTAVKEASARLEQAEVESWKKKRAEAVDVEVVNLLTLLQEKGRLVDFLMDDITPYSDEQVGAAARVVHQGCRSVLHDYFSIHSVVTQTEGSDVVVPKDYNQRHFRLVGKLTGDAPYRGSLLHRGWKTTAVKLPRVNIAEGEQTDGGFVISPAEVELR